MRARIKPGILVVLGLILSACAEVIPGLPTGAIAYLPTPEHAICAVTDVVDGDTIKLACKEGRQGTVRLTGYDTPETFRPGCSAEKALGEKATRTLTALYPSGFPALTAFRREC